MADYIKSNILSQAYIHIDPLKIDSDRLENLRSELELYLQTRGRFFIYDEVEASVEFKDGSLKVYAGIAGAIYIAISGYGSFRSGVDYLASDARRLADCIASETLYLTQSRHDNTVRVEARIGVVGSLKGIVDSIELLQKEIATAPMSKTAKRLEAINDEAERLMSNLQDPKDVEYVGSNLCELFKSLLPANPRDNPKDKSFSEFIVFYRDRRSKIIESMSNYGNGQKLKSARKKRTRKKKIG